MGASFIRLPIRLSIASHLQWSQVCPDHEAQLRVDASPYGDIRSELTSVKMAPSQPTPTTLTQ